jgi:TolB-like protein/Flp pilus assembly protein TadD
MASEEPAQPQSDAVRVESSHAGTTAPGSVGIWPKIKRHKVVEWSLAYIAFGYATLHGSQMLRETFEWSLAVPRYTLFALLLGLPVVVALAWYHGHRAEHRVSRMEISILAVLLLIAGSVLWGLSRPREYRLTQSSPASAAGQRSIAVLPFVDMSEKKDQEYFGDGMAEEILDLLSRLPQLTVIGRTSSFQFKGHSEDLREIGNKLKVGYIVEGSVRKAGPLIRVTAQLIDTQSGSHLWSDSYDREFGDVLRLQDEIATGITRALQLTVNAVDAPARRLENSEAYTLYLRGLSLLDSQHEEQLEQARSYFEQALALDPSLSRAAESLAFAYIAAGMDEDLPGDEAWQKAKVAADRALQLNKNSAIAHAVLGFVHGYGGFDWNGAEAEFSRALSLNPRDTETLYLAAEVAYAHRRQDAMQRINASLALDPLNPYAYQLLGTMLLNSGDRVGAEKAFRESLAITPTFDGSHFYIALIHLLNGKPQDALTELQSEVATDARDLGLALVNHALGRDTESKAALERLVRADAGVWPFAIAVAHAYRGETNEAFAWMDRAYTLRDSDFTEHLGAGGAFTIFDKLRGDARYAVLMRRMNLSE